MINRERAGAPICAPRIRPILLPIRPPGNSAGLAAARSWLERRKQTANLSACRKSCNFADDERNENAASNMTTSPE